MLSGCRRERMNSVDRMNASTTAWQVRKMYKKLLPLQTSQHMVASQDS